MARADIEMDMNLDSSGFRKGIQKSKKSLKNFAGSAMKSFGAIAGAAGLGAITSSSLSFAKEIKNLSTLTGESVEDFQRMAHAAQQFGIEQDKLADILKDVSDKVGDFIQTGGGPMADFFENIAPKVGVTAEQFKNLSGKDALQLYVSSLEAANLTQSDMTFYMEAIASDATLLLPLLKDNGKAFDELGNSLSAFLTEEEINKLAHYENQWKAWKAQILILSGKLLSWVIPSFKLLGNSLSWVGNTLGLMTNAFIDFSKFLGSNISAVIEPAVKSFEALAKGVEGALKAMNPKTMGEAKKLFKESKDLGKEAFSALLDIPEKIGENFSTLRDDATDSLRVFEQEADKIAADMGKNWDEMWNENVKTTESAVKKINKSTGGIGTDDKKKAKKTEGPIKVGAEIERKEGESGAAFMQRRQQARSAYLALQSDDAGYFNPKTMETLQAIARGEQPAGAGEKKPGGDVVEKNTTEMASLLTSINKGING